MSDSGFSGLPPGPRGVDITFPQGLAELKAKIIALRAEVRVENVRQKLEGEILRHNPDGTTQIKTERGEITVKFTGRNIPPEGARIEIEIPPGDKPQQITVRPAPPPLDAEQPQAPPPETPKTEIRTDKPVPRQTPVIDARTAEELARKIETLPADQRPAVTVKEQDVIRLLPYPREQVQDLIRPALELLRTTVTQLPQTPQLSLPDEFYERISQALTLPKQEHLFLKDNLPQQPPIFTQATKFPVPTSSLEALPAQARPVVQNTVQTFLQGGQFFTSLAALPPPLSILAPNFSNIDTVLKTPQASLLQPASITEALTALTTGQTESNAPLFSPRSSALDVRIQSIAQSSVKITAPDGQKAALLPQSIGTGPLSIPQITAGQITGEVIGLTAQSLPVLSFYLPGFAETQNFIMQFEAPNLPVGTQVQAAPLHNINAAAQTAQAAMAPFVPFDFFSGFSWPAMEELQHTLQQAAPQLAQVLSNVSANAAAPARMPMAALFFVAAVRAGDISGWLGDKTVDAMRRIGKGDVINRLSRDMNGMQRTANEPNAQDWRAMALPMMADDGLHKMMLYFRHDDSGDEQDQKERKGTRFIFDINLNRLGDVQLDGLHRPAAQDKSRLDLIVRTTQPLSADMQKSMRRKYIQALENAGHTGEMSFQGRADQFIKVEMPKEGRDKEERNHA